LSAARQAHIAFMRFGLGPKADSVAELAATDGAAYRACLAEVQNPAAVLIPDAQVTTFSSAANANVVLDYATVCRSAQVSFDPAVKPKAGDVLMAEMGARYVKATEPKVGFAERLVWFWSNHFSLNQAKSGWVCATVGQFERSVIRRNVFGKFSDMLKAVYQHPAMVTYLDNQYSTGPNSTIGKTPWAKAQKLSYNENLGREILELHTLGAYGGYTQDDVIGLSKVLTGWSIYTDPKNMAQFGQFRFDPNRHEPGPQTILGLTYSQPDITQGLAVFDALAAHPSTAQHIAFKLIKHFITDEPSPWAVRRLAGVFSRTGGDLQAVSRALLDVRGAWDPKVDRIIQPQQWQVSVLRGLGFGRDSIMAKTTGLGSNAYWFSQPIWGRLTPDGYPDDDYYWENTDFVRGRKEYAFGMVYWALAGDKMTINPEALAAALMPTRSQALVDAMAALKAQKFYDIERLAMLFSSPEYMLR
jgi:uncharacterized protein (DUF1800 family)